MIFDETKFIKVVRPHIERCRDGDWEHAKRVVRWVKILSEGREDQYLFIVSAYLHDIGWRDVLPPQKLTFDKLLEYEGVANSNSKPFITELLTSLEYIAIEIEFILKLVSAADSHKSSSDDEAIIVDSDNLSKLDINHLRDKFQPKEWMKMYKLWEKELPGRIKTKIGKEKYQELLDKLYDDIQKSI